MLRHRSSANAIMATALTAVLASVLAAAGTPVLAATPAAASVAISATTVPSAPDFATEAYADPWDYSNVEDLSPDSSVVGTGVSNTSYVNGTYNASVATGGWLDLVSEIDGSLPYGRDGRLHPIDTSRYTRMSVRMFSTAAATAQVYWFACGAPVAACFGATQFLTKPGWQTYDIAMANTTGTAVAWSGTMTGLRLYPSATANATIALDHIRLYQPSASSSITVSNTGASSAGQLVVDTGSNRASGTQTVVLRNGNPIPVPAGGTATLDASLLPQGSWYVGVQDPSGTITYAPSPLTVQAPPAPQVLDPSLAGGADYTDIYRGGQHWDFTAPDRILGTANVANGTFSAGGFSGTNGPPTPGDSQITLPVPVPIDGSRFHRLTFTASYDGTFGLADAPGGGMVARLIWQTAGNPAAYQDLNDVVVHPGINNITLDLATNPPSQVVDENNPNRIGWAGQQITSLRFDPNEDPGQRSWTVSNVHIAQDAVGAGSYTVRLQDANWAPGTTADVFVDTTGSGFNGTPVATGIPVAQGVNTVPFNLGSRPPGTYWVYATMHRNGASTSAYSTGPVQMAAAGPGGPVGPPVPVGPAGSPVPVGSLDSARQAPAGLHVSGWAADPQAPTTTTNVHIYVDGTFDGMAAAGNPRPDVDAANGFGPNHGFDAVVGAVAPGLHQVCAYAIRAPSGPNPVIGCQNVTVGADPIGSFDSVSAVTGGVSISGWSLDPDTAASTTVHVYVDGALATQVTASGTRDDLAAAYPGYGAAHGWSTNVPVAPGQHQVCTYGLNLAGPGSNALIACRQVAVSGQPFGSLDGVARSTSSVSVRGWLVDPTRAAGTQAHVYIDGQGAGILSVNGPRADVAATYPGFASSTLGFDGSVPLGAGPHQVCVYGVGAAGAALLSCTGV